MLSIVNLAWSQQSAAQPQVRPALIGDGPKALVNVINIKSLLDKGQRDGLLSFTCYVSPSGNVRSSIVYRGTPGSEELAKELKSALTACRFIPAIYNGGRTDVWFAGTVVFFVNDGKPRLRVYANQNHDDIKQGNDFIAPQVIPGTRNWPGAKYELEKARVYVQSGAVELSITVDASGKLRDMKVVSEDPAGFNFGHAVMKEFANAKYIPGFRNGRPVDSTFNYTHYIRAWKDTRIHIWH